MSTNRQLRTLAAELPFYPKCDDKGKPMMVDCTMTGAEIINRKIKIKVKGGGEIDATRKYVVPTYQPADHFTNMKKAYKKKGEQGVIDYCKMVKNYDLKIKSKLNEPA